MTPPREATARRPARRLDPRRAALFNRLVAREQTAELLSLLTQGRLVRINRSTFELEPWLAEKWESAPDGRTFTLHLRPGVTWSDGKPFTSADVLFTLQAVFDPRTESVVAEQLTVGRQADHRHGARRSHSRPHLPAAVRPGAAPVRRACDPAEAQARRPRWTSGTFANAWNSATPPADMVGHRAVHAARVRPGQRIVLDRNPRYWRKGATARSSRISIASSCRSCPIRTPSCCGCSRATST